MNSMERVMTAISHKEPDRVPLFLLLSIYGAKELGLSIEDYFSRPEQVVTAQLKMKEKYKNDCFYTFSYAAAETEAFGGETIFAADGPPNAGEPVVTNLDQIKNLKVPDLHRVPSLLRVLEVTRQLKEIDGGETPIIGVVMSPFSLPVMQLGFEAYLELLYFQNDLFEQLMAVNESFCIAWANAQLEAGATAICYFDPLASPTIIERETYLKTGNLIAQRALKKIKGAAAIHLASGTTLPVVDDIVKTGSAVLGFSYQDDVAALKAAARGRISLLGNLNGVEMVRWDAKKAREEVKKVIRQAAPGGGFILSDNHGEIPYQVSEEVLLAISAAVKEFGTYPIGAE